jgi:hypothetical protein
MVPLALPQSGKRAHVRRALLTRVRSLPRPRAMCAAEDHEIEHVQARAADQWHTGHGQLAHHDGGGGSCCRDDTSG